MAASLAAAGLPVVVVNPAQVRAFAQAMGKRMADPIDAFVIARFAEATRPEIRPLPDAELQALADLVARRRQIVAMIGAESQRLEQASPRTARSIERLLEALKRELADIDQEIGGAVRRTPAWLEKAELLKSVPGIGDQIAGPSWPKCPNSATSTAQIAALAGLAPGPASPASGAAGASSAADGRSHPKAHLHGRPGRRPAQSHPQSLPRPTGRGRLKPKMVAIIAVARKLLTSLNAIIREKQPWRAEAA